MSVKTNPELDEYFETQDKWYQELQALRKIVLDTPLKEEKKWNAPIYTHEGKNIVGLGGWKNCATLGFFKGALLKDPQKLMKVPGQQTQEGRKIEFTSLEEIRRLAPTLKEYILEAIEVEKAGLKVTPKQTADYEMPEELVAALGDDPEFKEAFEALTPGRQRGYILHFGGAKQSATRQVRIEKYRDKIFDGKGMNDW